MLYYYAQFLLFSLEDVDNALVYAQKVYDQKPNHPYTAFLIARCLNTAQDFGKAIQAIRNLVKNVELDSKNLRIANTELISYYIEGGKSSLSVETDIDNGISLFLKAFEVFLKCVKSSIVDYKSYQKFQHWTFTLYENAPCCKNRRIQAIYSRFDIKHRFIYKFNN